MNFAQDKAGSSRVTGIGIVIVIHALIIWALASGLATKIKEAVKGPIDVKVVEEKVKPPPPPIRLSTRTALENSSPTPTVTTRPVSRSMKLEKSLT